MTHSLSLSGHERKYGDVRCAAFGLGLGATKEHSRQRSVTEEQQRPRPNTAQPTGRPFFFALTALLAPYRPLKGMLVARALSARKIPGRTCIDNSVSQYQCGAVFKGLIQPITHRFQSEQAKTDLTAGCGPIPVRPHRNLRDGAVAPLTVDA